MGAERAVCKGTLGGIVQIRNMFTCDVVTSGGDTSAVLWDAYMTSLFAALDPLSSSQVNFYEYETQEYLGGSWVPLDVVTVNETGHQTGDLLPYQNAIVFIGKAAGLRRVGRKFIAGIAEANTSAGILTGGALINAAAFLVAWLTPFTGIGGGTITPGIVDRFGVFRPFVGGVVSSLIGSMRRRKPGLGI